MQQPNKNPRAKPKRKKVRQWWCDYFPKGQWHPQLAGLIKGYPLTQEAFDKAQARCREQVTRLNAQGKMGRRGVPDGWAGRKPEIERIRRRAAKKAKEIVAQMREEELLNTDDARAEAALEMCVGLMLERDAKGHPLNRAQDRLSAAKTILEYTRKKPATQSEVKVSKAEEFLALVASELAPK
jgi:hypothetical protein